jgi:hypothetical protein
MERGDSMEAKRTDGLRGGVMMATSDEGQMALRGILHHQGRVRKASLHQKGRAKPWCKGSPQREIWQRCSAGVAALR